MATGQPGAPAAPRPCLLARLTARVRRSMALQIALAISGVTVLLIVAGSWMVSHLLAQNFDGLYPPMVYSEGMVSIKEEVLQERRLAFAAHAWRIILITLGAGALAASLFAWWITRRILASAERLAHTANRISGQALHERLAPGRSPAELEPVAVAFNHMLDRLQDAFARLSGFSSDVAHDLRAPIHRLLTATQVTLSRPRSAEEYRAVLESAVPVYERMGRLVENILFLARSDQAQTTIHATPIVLAQRLVNTADFFGLLAEERGLRLALLVEGPAQVWADDTLLTRAVANLLTNAIRHARSGSTVMLSAAASPDGGCHLSVTNEGEPIAPEHQARIFERNYRIEGPRTEEPPGSGLGLAIVKSTMDLHGGTVSVRSAPGQPTVFTLSFPPQGRGRS
jgi:two-component system heavy metal sensor histidine kinase CusS